MSRHAVSVINDEGAWLEAIGLLEAIRDGQRQTAGRLLRSAVDPDRVAGHLLSLVGVLLRGIEPAQIDRFIEAAHRAAPPPPIENRPDQSVVAPGYSGTANATTIARYDA